MGNFYETIPETLIPWLLSQKLFFIATAPLSPHGHVNVSPKGISPTNTSTTTDPNPEDAPQPKNFGIPNPTTFWYLDLSGSGNETISHLLEPQNARITVLFQAFVGPPRIVRLWGRGRVLEHGSGEFDAFVAEKGVEIVPGTRSVVIVDVHQVGTSCGFSVPFFEYKGHRETLNELWRKREGRFLDGRVEEGMDRYWAYKNAWSMDGLPGMRKGLETAKTYNVAPITKMVGPMAPKGYRAGGRFGVQDVLLVALLGFILGCLVARRGFDVIEFSRSAVEGW